MKTTIVTNMLLLLSIIFVGNSCTKYVTVDSLNNQLLAGQVFSSDGSTNSAIIGMYRKLKDGQFGSTSNITLLTGLSSDEVYNLFSNTTYDDYKNNSIQTTNNQLPWANFYNVIYQANTAIENIQGNNKLSVNVRNQYLGEAKFCRAFCYFYLVNLFGDVPLLTTSNVTITASAGRSPVAVVYSQIISDLKNAQDLLINDYSYSSGEHTRANKWVATALLSRVYLYQKDWANAEVQATALIASNNYSLTSLTSIFDKNNNESILQWANTSTEGNYEPNYFIFTTTPNILCTNFLLNAFEAGDQRKSKWINAGTYAGQTYYYPYKFKVVGNPSNEYYTVLRLAEQYLIRSEARAQQNNVNAAVTDLNVIRQRAGIPTISTTISQDSCLNSILHERQVELFAEGGHRWFDLKRTSKIDTILNTEKSGIWKSSAALFPIPLSDMQKDVNLTQNSGY